MKKQVVLLHACHNYTFTHSILVARCLCIVGHCPGSCKDSNLWMTYPRNLGASLFAVLKMAFLLQKSLPPFYTRSIQKVQQSGIAGFACKSSLWKCRICAKKSSRFQSYLSCCILLYDGLQKRLHGRRSETCDESLDLISKSLQVLSWAGQLDPTANHYHATLNPIFDTMLMAAPQSSKARSTFENIHDHFVRFSGKTTLCVAAKTVLQMLYVPWESGQHSPFESPTYRLCLEQTATSLDEVGLGVHLYWALEFAAASRLGATKETRYSERTIPPTPSKVFPKQLGYFAGRSRPLGWTLSKSFLDASLIEGSTTNIM